MIDGLLRLKGDGTGPGIRGGTHTVDEILAADEPKGYLEHTVRTTITIPAWATADQVAEAMEILDASLEPVGWHGVRPGWGATTIYAAPRRTA